MVAEAIQKGYKQTEIGVIPEDWEEKKLDEVCSITAAGDLNKKSFSKIEDEKHPYPIYSNSLTNKGLYGYSSEYRYKENCVTITARGSLGVAFPRDHKFDAIIRVLVLSPIKKLNCYFVSEYINQRVKFSIESTGVPQLTSPQISRYKIAFPEYEEQSAIAQVLSETDELIQQLNKLISKKKNIKKGVMQELLTGNKRLSGFSGEWEVKTIKETTDCIDNLRVPLNDNQRLKIQGDIPYCGANGVLDYINDYVIDDDIILIAEDGGYFDEYEYRPIAYRMIGKCWVNNHAHILKAKANFDQGFIFYSLVHKNILRFLSSGTRAKLNKSEMYKIEIDVSSEKSEQSAIAKILSDIDSDIEKLEQKRDKYQMIKKGMMQQLLTGRIRLKH